MKSQFYIAYPGPALGWIAPVFKILMPPPIPRKEKIICFFIFYLRYFLLNIITETKTKNIKDNRNINLYNVIQKKVN